MVHPLFGEHSHVKNSRSQGPRHPPLLSAVQIAPANYSPLVPTRYYSTAHARQVEGAAEDGLGRA